MIYRDCNWRPRQRQFNYAEVKFISLELSTEQTKLHFSAPSIQDNSAFLFSSIPRNILTSIRWQIFVLFNPQPPSNPP